MGGSDDWRKQYLFGAAADPYGKIDWDYVSTFASIPSDTTHMLYLPQSAYKGLFNYYASYGYTSLSQIFEEVLGLTIADGTNLVCDVAEYKSGTDGDFVSCTYYYSQFRAIQKEFSKNSDYIDLRVCMNDKKPSELKNKRFAGGLNIKTTDHSPINGWGKAENRFAGLMVLGVQNSKLY